MTRWGLFYFGFAVLAAALASGCGGGSDGAPGAISTVPAIASAQADTALPIREVALAETLAELERFDTPTGVDASLFAELKAELARVLKAHYSDDPGERAPEHYTSALSLDDRNRAWCLQGHFLPDGSATVYWRGRHYGDYNLDGLVSINDLTPLGFHYLKDSTLDDDGLPMANGDNEWVCQVDGNGDQLITINDITPIGQNFQSRLIGYRIYLGIAAGSGDVNWNSTFEPNAENPVADYTLPFNDSRDEGIVHRYTYAFPMPELAADEICWIRVVAWTDQAEDGVAGIPLVDGPHAMFNCDVCHRVTDMEFRGRDGSCSVCHAAPPEDMQSSWAASPGLHSSCTYCHQQHVFTIAPRQSICSNCHSTIASIVTSAGMPDCFGCHEMAHLPDAQPGAAYCKACHATPPDSAADWSAAPGLHGDCTRCHGVHVFTIAPPESICGNCHAAQIASGHGGGDPQCLNCHNSAHVPEMTVTGDTCLNCHPNPPENPAAAWADAPGSHANCVLCHIEPEHGNKPVPPESICGDCHGALITTGHAGGETECLGCHNFPHLPEIDVTGTDCKVCHTNPPEKPSASWTDAPGQHAACVQCHDETNHGDKPIPPESVCDDCHGQLIIDNHAGGDTQCMGCHVYAHLPDYSGLGIDDQCLTCHEDYTGWGNHTGSCFDCHTTGGHPPGGGWDACINCHDY